MKLELRPYQEEALAAVEKAETKGIRRPLVALPTGTGKTVLFAHAIARRGGRALVLAHREELLDQAAAKISSVIDGAWVGVVQANRNESLAPIIVGSVQTLSRPNRLAQLGGKFDTIVVDEAHHAAADSYRFVLNELGSFSECGPLTIGVTATPMRGDGVGLSHVFEDIVYERSILEMIAEGWLCDLRAKQILLEADFSALGTSRGDYVQGQAAKMLMAANAPEHIARAWLEHAPEKKGIVFTPTVDVAHACAEQLREVGIPAEGLDGTTASDERRAILARLKSGETRVVANCAVLTEGFDEPSIECVAIARPTKSRTLYMQMIGRGTRKFPGKDDCLILDLVGSSSDHDLCTVSSLFGLSLSELDKGSVAEAAQKRQKDGQPMVVNGRLVAVDLDLLRDREAKWVGSGGAFALSIGDGRYIGIRPPAEGSTDPVQVVLSQDASTRYGRPTSSKLGEAPTIELALGLAESYAKKMGSEKLIDPNARWRQDPCSEGQQRYARRLGVRLPDGCTKGMASQLIDQAKARGRF